MQLVIVDTIDEAGDRESALMQPVHDEVLRYRRWKDVFCSRDLEA